MRLYRFSSDDVDVDDVLDAHDSIKGGIEHPFRIVQPGCRCGRNPCTLNRLVRAVVQARGERDEAEHQYDRVLRQVVSEMVPSYWHALVVEEREDVLASIVRDGYLTSDNDERARVVLGLEVEA